MVKDIIEISEYEINIDEETNANSIIRVLKKTNAKADDILVFKKNNKVIYWGIIQNIQSENGKLPYIYTVKYITNMFDEKIQLNKKRIEDRRIKNGYYKIKLYKDTNKILDISNGSTENKANVQIWEDTNVQQQKFKIIEESDGFYTIQAMHSNKVIEVQDGVFQSGQNVQQYENNNSNAQKWEFINIEKGVYIIKTKENDLYLDINGGNTENGTNVQVYSKSEGDSQKFILERLEEESIKEEGIEDFLAKKIEENFINSNDIFINKKFIEVRVKSHTKLQTSVSNVQDNLFNLHTYMTNCTQLYNINYEIFIENKKLIIEIENRLKNKELIDLTAQTISNYREVFETKIVSKVEVLTDTETYTLFLLNDRTTTTDQNDKNRIDGITERTFTSKIEEANQKALDVITVNSYNHNISFNMYKKYIKIGTPVAIKTQESVIHDTYISSIKITSNRFIEYVCGNIRTNFIDKLLKERNK